MTTRQDQQHKITYLPPINFTHSFELLMKESADAKFWSQELKDLKRASLVEFLNQGLPLKNNEDWRFTPLKAFFESLNTTNHGEGEREEFKLGLGYQFSEESVQKVQQTLNEFLLKNFDKDAYYLVFINGNLHLELSSEVFKDEKSKIKITSLDTKGALPYLKQRANFQYDSFYHLNQVYFSSGSFIEVTEDAIIEPYVHLIHLTVNTVKAPLMTFPRHVVKLEKGAQLKLRESYLHINDDQQATSTSKLIWQTPITDIYLNEGAHLDHYKLVLEGMQTLHVAQTFVSVPASALYQSYLFQWAGKMVRNTLYVHLDGKDAQCELYGLYALKDGEHSDVYAYVDHNHAESKGQQLYKGILDGKSHGVFKGKVTVKKGAQKITSAQLNKNLLLHNLAHMDSQPQLEILADDVQCSHGATTNKIRQDELFYLQSRGISTEKAKKLLCHAFGFDVINKVSDEELKNHLEKIFYQYFERLVSTFVK